MTEKTIKLNNEQLAILKTIANPNLIIEARHFDEQPVFDELETLGLISIKRGGGWIPEPYLTPAGRAYLDSLGIAPIPVAPPPKTDKERIAELEAEVKRLDKMITAITVYSGNIQDSVHCYERMAKIRQVLLEAGKE